MDDLSIDDFCNLSDASEEPEVQVTPAEVIELMEEAWVNEKFAPEILPNKSEIVEIILQQISSMEDNIKELTSIDFTRNIYSLEIDRLKYLVSSYLRTRLEKIETYVNHILEEEDNRLSLGKEQYLTDQELQFAKNYSKSFEEYFEKLMRFYPGVPADTWSNKIIEPNINSFVFLKSKKRIEGVSIEAERADSDIIDIQHKSQVIISYKSVAQLVKNGDVHLI